MSNVNEFKNILAVKLVSVYLLSPEMARTIVEESAVNKMLNLDDDARDWQMHQPLDYTVESIYREYKGLPIEL